MLPQWPHTTRRPSGWIGSAGCAGCSSGITITGLRLIIRLLWVIQTNDVNAFPPTLTVPFMLLSVKKIPSHSLVQLQVFSCTSKSSVPVWPACALSAYVYRPALNVSPTNSCSDSCGNTTALITLTSWVEGILSSGMCLYKLAGSCRDIWHTFSQLVGFWLAMKRKWESEIFSSQRLIFKNNYYHPFTRHSTWVNDHFCLENIRLLLKCVQACPTINTI